MAEEKGLINESVKKVKDFVNEKLSSPFWVSFIVAWLICNWKFWYITFFIDEKLLLENEHKLKISYIESFYNWDYKSLNFIPYKDLFFPLAISFFIYFVMSYFSVLFYRKSIKDDLWRENYKNSLLKARSANMDEEEKIKRNQEEIWEIDFNKFSKLKFFSQFSKVIEWIHDIDNFDYDEEYKNYKELIDYCIDFEIISKERDISYKKIGDIEKGDKKMIFRFHPKGKYFSRRFQEKTNK